MFAIDNLRQPLHFLDATTKKQLDRTTQKHKRIDDAFLTERIKPRYVIFMEDGADMVDETFSDNITGSPENPKKAQSSQVAKKRPNNVAININKYIAKYDFDIAAKLQRREREEGADGPERDEHEVREQFATNAILEVLQVCSNVLSKDDRCYQSIWTLDAKQVSDLDELDPDCKICLVSHLPAFNKLDQANIRPRRRTASGAPEAQQRQSAMGLRGNEFAISTWKDYYQLSLRQA